MAEESYSEAQLIYQQIGEKYSSANILWYLGWLYGKHAQYGAAERVSVMSKSAVNILKELADYGAVINTEAAYHL
ncbi:hypothetical protein FRC00_009861 [Tulasnella sp. 408]|nr:hypothetical protein FRC00_009861 [Tulasnella sp. 408]